MAEDAQRGRSAAERLAVFKLTMPARAKAFFLDFSRPLLVLRSGVCQATLLKAFWLANMVMTSFCFMSLPCASFSCGGTCCRLAAQVATIIGQIMHAAVYIVCFISCQVGHNRELCHAPRDSQPSKRGENGSRVTMLKHLRSVTR